MKNQEHIEYTYKHRKIVMYLANKYVKEEEKPTINTKHNNKNSFNEVINMVKNMDVDKVQEGITSLQKALSLLGDLVVSKNNPTSSNNNYTPRPVYKRFED